MLPIKLRYTFPKLYASMHNEIAQYTILNKFNSIDICRMTKKYCALTS